MSPQVDSVLRPVSTYPNTETYGPISGSGNVTQNSDTMLGVTTAASFLSEPQTEPSSWWNRFTGALKFFGGVSETALGAGAAVITSPTVVGTIGGGAVVLHGLDTVAAGAQQIWTGQETRTYTAQGLTELSGSETFGDVADAGIGIFGSIGAGLARVARGAISLAEGMPAFVRGGAKYELAELPANTLGITDPVGNITLQIGLPKNLLESTLKHEQVHQFLSPKDGIFASLRGAIAGLGYKNSDFLRFTEEAIAESVASGSLRRGIEHGLSEGYSISVPKLAVESAVVSGVVGKATASGLEINQSDNE